MAIGVKEYISDERLDIYQKFLKIDKKHNLGAYNWNKALIASIQPLVHCLEVSLRNAIDHVIQTEPPTGVAGQYLTDKNWIFDLPRFIGDKIHGAGRVNFVRPNGSIKYKHLAKLTYEEKSVAKVCSRIMSEGKYVSSSRVISGLDFGFWTNFLNSQYDNSFTNELLWPEMLFKVFPGAPRSLGRTDLEFKFSRIREIRNRLAHNEAIWKFHYVNPATNKPDYTNPVYGFNASISLLKKSYEDMLEALSWISHERYQLFLDHGHQHRFYALCSSDGLNMFIDRSKISTKINIRKRKDYRRLLKSVLSHQSVCLVDAGEIIGVINSDLVRLK